MPQASSPVPPSSARTALYARVFAGVLVIAVMALLGVAYGRRTARPAAAPPGAGKNAAAYLSDDDPAVKVDALAPRHYKAIDVHEHAQTVAEADRLVTAMDKLGVQRVCLMASTIFTFTLDNKYGFEGFKENNEELLKIKEKYPDRFCAFVTFDPLAEGNLELVKDYVARGADGLKLYLGHGAGTGKGPFHVMPLDDARMDPVYAWAEQAQLPITLHVNLIKYWDEMVRVLEKHPYLRVNLPHFGLHKETEKRLNRLAWLLDRYPNVYSDVSFGHPTFQLEGFESLAESHDRSTAFMRAHKDKMLFASDMVLEATKDETYIENTMRSYMQLLEAPELRLFLVPQRTMHGLALPEDVLRSVYETAPAHFLLLDAAGKMPDRTHGGAPPGLVLETKPLRPLADAQMPPR